MRFSCEKALLLNAAALASRAVTQKNAIPALEGILIEAADTLTLTGYNLETGIRSVTPADISRKGAVVINAKVFVDILRQMHDDIITVDVDNNLHISLRCRKSHFNIIGIEAGEYPEFPGLDRKNTFSIEQSKFKTLVSQTIFAVSDNESRPVYSGELFEIQGNSLTAAALDGFRVAIRKETVKNENGGSFSFIVPGSALKEAEKIASDTDDLLEISRGSKHITFQFGSTMLISRLLDGDFLDYKNAIPRTDKKICVLDSQQIRKCVDRVSTIISDSTKTPIRCTFGFGEVKLQTQTALASAYDECQMDGDGGNVEIGFNYSYLLDALRAVPTERIIIELGGSVTPVVIVPAEGEEIFLYMILPVRLKTT
ncbi:MAG: DNA polymerase III subunit beta [Clostridiales bacterium]|nr:DNA polymerase III subunit beta [Clostridiales bacterium]